ncbi:hypothetical protein SGQ83_06340 [Flavobacterium sp. Fl-318]|jgi:hypothetical protein|uniref:Outer membrane protein beta-barrel domain-containing protein n=1 Tax=Flavobacterium cupriresistens TaxID=2893885 RepID=A0ABU4RAF0_9FLAO|nr:MULTISPECIES: hypothetical protein [unclassified Flavobacterium]MDX6188958.1 hypothetical protein [Flavobacterium sp. Fl-318]UFH44261.1 hypothetical protein LNP23_08570 [Flavobacterium sp. F-323]
MTKNFRALFYISTLLLLSFNQTKAQKTGNFIKASIGFASSSSLYIENYGQQDEVDVMGSGFYTEGEYVFGITSWFSVRPYAGIILTSPDKNPELQNQPQYKVNTRAFLVGGKIRLCAPIPWVAPFIETGIGASIGSFETFTPSHNFNKSDVLMHIPINLGLAVGPKNNIEIAVSFYVHPAAKQSTGVFAAGFSFPID